MARILIVDDHAANREFLTTLLAYKGHETREACDGEEALALARGMRPDLIITDILMPTMDGYEFVRQLRGDPNLATSVVVFCTADYHERDAQRLAKDCGVSNVLIKPCEPDLVLRTVETALGLATETPVPVPSQEFDRDHLRLLTDKLSQKTAALENANQRLAAIIDISMQLAEESDPRRLLIRVCRAARELIGARYSALAASATRSEQPDFFFTNGLDAATVQGIGTPQLRQGLLGLMLEQRKAYRSALFDRPKNTGLPAGFPPARALLGVPIMSLQNTHGWLCLGDKVGGGKFTDEDERLLTILGSQVGRMYETATLYAQARSDAAALQLLHQITRAIGERQDLRSIFQVVIRTLEESMPMDFACICLHDPAQQVLTITSVGVRSSALAMELALTEQSRVPVEGNDLAKCVAGNLVYEPDIGGEQSAFARRLSQAGLQSLVAAPLGTEGKVFGVLLAARRQLDAFSASDREFMLQLSDHVALAGHQAQLYSTLQQAYEDLRRSQQANLKQERLLALGQMASGVAHDINNAISPIALYTESLLELETTLTPRARAYLGTIQRAIEGVAQTVMRMREFYRQREAQLAPAAIALNRVVTQAVEITRARWSDLPLKRGIVIALDTQLDPELPDIEGMEGEVRDALINMIINAVDAMPEGGVLRIRTYGSVANPGKVTDQDAVHLEVSDTGVGMDEATRQRCLEPFFTTKGERGTGLGLATVYGMTQRHNAELDIESLRGHGTSLRLKFPVAHSAPGFENWQPAQAAARSRPLSILLVDDDPLILQSLRDTLQNEGHEVTTTDGGQAGIAAFTEHPGKFALVITDLGMPYVDGRKVAQAVKEISPHMPVIMLTGWGHTIIADNEIPPHVDKVMSKPPKLADLRRVFVELVPPHEPGDAAAPDAIAQSNAHEST